MLVERIMTSRPAISRIDSVTITEEADGCDPIPSGFTIAPSCNEGGGEVTDVSPDIAICPDCLEDMRRQPRRRDYPLTNCTHCGPRFSITRGLPYDRPVTSMAPFAMCDSCRHEYDDPSDRRFHAQPIACNDCGPHYSMEGAEGHADIVARTAGLLASGRIVMVKGLGGYNLLADATDSAALAALRTLKHRPRKPFAVMVSDLAMAQEYVALRREERESLASWRAPIVICRRTDASLPEELAPGLRTLGVMLPYMGFQHQLMEELRRPVVVTSANFPGAPIISDDAEARRYAQLHDLPLVSYNREIHNRVDDSVVRVIAGEPRILRRGRGFVPDPLRVSFSVDGVMALGADVTGGWALGRGNDIIASQYIGSLDAGEAAENFLRESIERMSALYRFTPGVVAVDAHSGYASSRIGREIAAQCGAEVETVWHHHAHAAAVMAEYGIEDEVIALVLDGTGAGPDATVWGSELLRCSLTSFTRLAHGPYLPMPGGDAAAREPWRMAVSLWRWLGRTVDSLPQALVDHVGEVRVAMVWKMIERGFNSPLSCGAGRLWDAVAALAGLCYENSYEAEAPVVLEGAADEADGLARRFHDEFAALWSARVVEAARAAAIDRVVLTGGVMQNDRIASAISKRLTDEGLRVFMPRMVTPGDGSIAAGQIAVVAARRRMA